MVRPHLEYGNAVWGPCYMGDLKLVEGVQRRATKLIPYLHDIPYEGRLRALQLPSMEYRRKRGDMIQMYKIMKGLVRMKVTDLFIPIPLPKTRGHKQRILRQRSLKAVRAKSFSQRTIEMWNCLPSNVIEAPSVDTSKKRIDEAWKEKMYKASAV